MTANPLSFILALVPVVTYAQYDKTNVEALAQKHKNSDVVYLADYSTITIQPGSTGLSITNQVETATLHLTDKTAAWAQQEISYVRTFNEIKDIEAYTLVPKGEGKYRKAKVTKVTERHNTSEDVFYDDVSVKEFIFPEPGKGAINVLRYTDVCNDPHFLTKFYFASGRPVEKAVFTIRVHKSVTIGYVLKNPTTDIEYTKTEKGSFIIHTWTRINIPKLIGEPQAKSIAYETPHIIPRIISFKQKGEEVKLLDNTKGLYNYCYSLLCKGMEAPDEELKRVTDSVTNGHTGEEAKTKAIYDYVQKKFTYIAFEDGLGGFIPRPPNLVNTRRFGDCKDLSNLLVTMLNHAGVKAYHTWVGTNAIPYTFSELPVMGVANHMIVAARIGNRWNFLDGTARFLSYRYPSDFVQGKQAMIGIGKDSFILENIPVIDAKENLTIDSFWVSLSGDTLTGRGVRTYRGLSGAEVASTQFAVSGKRLNEVWEAMLEVGQNNCKVTDLKVLGLQDRDSLLQFFYNFKVPRYLTTLDGEKYLNMNFLKLWKGSDVDLEKRTREYIFDQTNANQVVSIFAIPAGYAVQALPPDITVDKGDFGFRFGYTLQGNTVIYRQQYWYNSLVLNKPDFVTWNEVVEKLLKAYSKNLVLTPVTQK